MSKSSLATATYLAHSSNYTKGIKGYRICKITIHHMAGHLTAKQCGNVFKSPNRNASSNYGIGYDGEIACYVEEENRAWTSSCSWNDCQAITIEVANSSVGENYPVSNASWNSLINLCVDICRRYGFRLTYDGTKNGSLTRHNMFANTNCPGAYLQSKFPELVKIVNERLDGGVVSKPIPEGSDEQVRVYQNGSTSEIVYCDSMCKNKIGSLDPNEKCDCFGIFNGVAMVRYQVGRTENYKIGFCKWTGGVR